MNCLEFRQATLSDPYRATEQQCKHKANCPACARFDREIHALDQSTRSALTVAVPEGFAAKILLNQSFKKQPRMPTRRYWLSMAASFLLAAIVFQLKPVDALEGDIVTHLNDEAHQVHGKSGDITAARVNEVLKVVKGSLISPVGKSFDMSFGKVTYASKCLIDDKWSAHFVVEDGGEPYTLILIPGNGDSQHTFNTGNWHGIIIPHATGNLALIASNEQPDINLLPLAEHYGRLIDKQHI